MKTSQLENRLLAARRTSAKPSVFAAAVMARLQTSATNNTFSRTTNVTKWSYLMKYAMNHKLQTTAIALTALTAVGFSGYAYASGTDPVSLVKRIVTGQRVEVKYQGHTYQYGSGRSYSDAAITAFAELNTIRRLHFLASNDLGANEPGIEYINSANASATYIYPWIGTVTQIIGQSAVVDQSYTLGDKANNSTDTNRTVTLPLGQLSFSTNGQNQPVSKLKAGQTLVVYTDSYRRHVTGTNSLAPVTHYFAYATKHTLAEMKEADQTRGAASANTSQQGIHQTDDGLISHTCLNNVHDQCTWQDLKSGEGQSFFFTLQYYELSPANPAPGQAVTQITLATPRAVPGNNPDVIAFGEMLATPSDATVTRNTQGRITKLDGDTITIASTSGTLWTFQLKSGTVAQFNQRWNTTLKVGDTIGACLVADPNNLDNHTFDYRHIYMLVRP